MRGHVSEPCKKANPIETLLGQLTGLGPRNHVLNGVQIPKGKEQFFGVVCLQTSVGNRCLLHCTSGQTQTITTYRSYDVFLYKLFAPTLMLLAAMGVKYHKNRFWGRE